MFERLHRSLGDHVVGRAHLILLFVFCSVPVHGATDAESSLIERTDRFEFHSNFWINLHHFLFQQAQRDDGEPMDGGRLLSRAEFAQIDGAIDWYRDRLAGRSLLMDRYLYKVKRTLIEFDVGMPIDSDAIDDEHLAQLVAAAPVYEQHYWSRHDRQNREILDWHRDRILRLEHQVLDRISELAQEQWPDELIRVDLTWDANWAGAYCTVEPIHAVLTSRPGGPKNTWPPGGWLELLFHEPSHALIDPDSSTVGKVLRESAEQLGHRGADQLWHAVLFLFSGTAVQEALREEGVSHELLMVSESIFARYQPAVNEGFASYIASEDTLSGAAQETIDKLASTE